MKTKRPAPKSMTIDKLILGYLADGGKVTAKQMSRMWGEDEVRCQGWLDTFAKAGLCRIKHVEAGERNKEHDRYVGRVATIRKYLEAQT